MCYYLVISNQRQKSCKNHSSSLHPLPFSSVAVGALLLARSLPHSFTISLSIIIPSMLAVPQAQIVKLLVSFIPSALPFCPPCACSRLLPNQARAVSAGRQFPRFSHSRRLAVLCPGWLAVLSLCLWSPVSWRVLSPPCRVAPRLCSFRLVSARSKSPAPPCVNLSPFWSLASACPPRPFSPSRWCSGSVIPFGFIHQPRKRHYFNPSSVRRSHGQ